MDTIFMNSETHKLLLNLSDKINVKRSDNMLRYQTLVCAITGKIEQSHMKTINLK